FLRLSVGNGEHPGRGLARAAEIPCRLPHHHHRVVKHFLDQLGTLEQRCQEPRQARLVEAVQPLECGEVLARDAREQLTLVQSGRSYSLAACSLEDSRPAHFRTFPIAMGVSTARKGSRASRI